LPLAAALGYSTAVLHTYGIGPFITPLQQEFGWSRAAISIGITIAGLAGAALSVPMGLLVDRLGPRVVGLIGVLLMTDAIALLGTATGDKANWIFLWCVVAFGNLWLQTTVWTSAVASRFERSRGLAFAITLSGASVAQTVFPILATWLITSYGWRKGFMGMGGIWAAVVFPMLLLFFRGARDASRKEPTSAADASTAVGMTVAEGLRSPAFYKLLAASGLFTFTALGLIVHFVPIMTDRGADPGAAAKIAALVGIFSMIGRLGTGVLLDGFRAHLVGAAVFLLPIVACVLLLYDGANPTSQQLAAAIFGLTVGAEVDVIAYLVSRHFGLRRFGFFIGAMVGALTLGVAFGPLAAGAVFDKYDSYAQFLVLTIAFMAATSLALATLGRPRFGAQSEPRAT
jgi:MFS family permease